MSSTICNSDLNEKVSGSSVKNDLLLRALGRERTERTPVWLMRQAGRADPAYRRLRDHANLPLEAMFRDPDLAAEASLLPKRLGVDAIILFQDILTPLGPMGASFSFQPGPVLNDPIRNSTDIDRLRSMDPASDLPFIRKTFSLIQRSLNDELPVLGFAGAPLTLAFFLIEGKSPGLDPVRSRAMMRDDPAALHRLLDKLADMTADYLLYQVECGADAVQLFESVADLISPQVYETFAYPYHVKVFSRLSGRVPTILFAKEHPHLEWMVQSGADALSVGTCVDLKGAATRFGDRVAFQGNVDNQLVAHGPMDAIENAVRDCILAGGSHGHILNLNHGLLPETPIDHVLRFIETAKVTRAGSKEPAPATD